jgi:hypothetical protein
MAEEISAGCTYVRAVLTLTVLKDIILVLF